MLVCRTKQNHTICTGVCVLYWFLFFFLLIEWHVLCYFPCATYFSTRSSRVFYQLMYTIELSGCTLCALNSKTATISQTFPTSQQQRRWCGLIFCRVISGRPAKGVEWGAEVRHLCCASCLQIKLEAHLPSRLRRSNRRAESIRATSLSRGQAFISRRTSRGIGGACSMIFRSAAPVRG